MKRSEALKLPEAVRAELDKVLRATAYGQYIELAAWLHDLGHQTSKSGLHRYGQALRKLDAENGSHVACVSETMQASRVNLVEEQQQLFLELGQLRYREERILERLHEIDEDIS